MIKDDLYDNYYKEKNYLEEDELMDDSNNKEYLDKKNTNKGIEKRKIISNKIKTIFNGSKEKNSNKKKAKDI